MSEVTLFLDLEGTELTVEERQLLKNPLIGGVILFGRNTLNAQQVARLVKDIRQVSPGIIISLDQEGGRVQRLKDGVTRLPAVKALASRYENDPEQGLSAAKKMGYLMATELRSLDIDLSFAPVLDIDYGRNSVIGDRAFACHFEAVSALSHAYIKGMRDAGMVATGKHFPGHGWANADTHLHDAIDDRTFEEIWATDLVPFRDAVENGVEAMMFAHVVYPQCDPSPAGFSRFWIDEVLRKQIGFSGVVFSDDLSMKAAQSAGSYASRADQAIASGCQALLCCNERRGTLDILAYLEAENLKPLKQLESLRGRAATVESLQLESARSLANEMLDV